MPSWPGTLPSQFLGLTDSGDDTLVRTAMDAGPPTVRRRYTSYSRSVKVPIVLTGTQRQTFDTFYWTTLKHGSLSFDWEDPVTDSTVTFRFKKPVSWSLARGGTAATRIWSGTLDLEILP